MKTLYFGGQKSGKSNAATAATLRLSNAKNSKPYYIATYDNSYDDIAMAERVNKHQQQRLESFITIEQTINLPAVMTAGHTYLVDCLSMWLFNNLERTEDDLIAQLSQLFALDCDIVFVLNDVGSGVIPMDAQSRRFVDFTGIIGQFVAAQCDEVFRVHFGIAQQIK